MGPVRLGLIGGGPGAFIGPIHRIAAEMDRSIRLVAGAFSSSPERSRAAGASYGIDPARAYGSVEEMIAVERDRADGIEMVAIATPNHLHHAGATAALSAGLAVMSDKPMTASLAEAVALAHVAQAPGARYALTYTYSGYPMVREMRARVAAGEIGRIRKVAVEYLQGWLAGPATGKQAEWRVDPARAGMGGCIGDIGVHAFHLVEFVTGLRVSEVLADLAAVVPGRMLDDDASILLRFDNGARGSLLASQIAIGERNGLSLRIYGDAGSLAWHQERPNQLIRHHADSRTEIVQPGDAALGADAIAGSRTPGGHPEGYLEAFANLYWDFARMLRGGDAPLLAGAAEGVRSMAFIEAAATNSGRWTRLCVPEVTS